MFVLSKDMGSGDVVLGENEQLFRRELTAKGLNLSLIHILYRCFSCFGTVHPAVLRVQHAGAADHAVRHRQRT